LLSPLFITAAAPKKGKKEEERQGDNIYTNNESNMISYLHF
jgi:hypothetical protein